MPTWIKVDWYEHDTHISAFFDTKYKGHIRLHFTCMEVYDIK